MIHVIIHISFLSFATATSELKDDVIICEKVIIHLYSIRKKKKKMDEKKKLIN